MIVHKLAVSTRLICNCERLCQMMRTIRSISIPGWFSPQLPHQAPDTDVIVTGWCSVWATWTPQGWPRQWQPGGMRDLLVVAITILPSPTFNPSLGTLSSQDSQALRTVDWHWHHCYKVSYQNIFNGSKLGNLSDKDFCKYIFVVCW